MHIKNQIIRDDPCPELSRNAQNLVFGEGNPNADILFIGEAPGKQEDKTGRPFIGAAGKFLNEMLSMIHLDRNDIYITNIVKYRPPNNRDPSPAEKTAFLSYLQDQIEVIKPKIIATLGRHSLNCFLPDLQISMVHGQLQEWRTLLFLPLFHPAAALYNGAKRQTLIDDFMQIPTLLKNN
ncbi:MAG: type-4 uracil-DNA glycosylase [Candidatus Saccharimonadales bacterium]